MKARGRHCVLEQRIVAKQPVVDRQVTVVGGLCEGHVGAAGPQVDGLRPDQDEGVKVIPECIERVEEGGPGRHHVVIGARRAHSAPSS